MKEGVTLINDSLVQTCEPDLKPCVVVDTAPQLIGALFETLHVTLFSVNWCF